MITLHFNPQFDSGAWFGEPGRNQCFIGDKYVGPMGFLADLEIRLGITAYETPQHEIVATYAKAAQKIAKQRPTVFFSNSLALSPLATSQELLKWRDELVLSGWKADTIIPEQLTIGAKSILNGLADVEKALPADFRTIADRWKALITALEKVSTMDGFSIKVHVLESHMHPIYKAVLKNLRRCGISVETVFSEQTPEVEIKHFHDSTDACLWTAAQCVDKLLVCSEDKVLSSAMSAFGYPYGNASSSETPRPISHLFTSAMMLLKDGGDIQAFRDYLSAPSHPLNRFEKDNRNLRKTLLESIIHKRGFEDFDKIIISFAEGNPDRLADIRRWIPEPNQPLTYSRIKLMCDQISAWANQAIKAVEDKENQSIYIDQWQELASACEEMDFQCLELGFNQIPIIPNREFTDVLRSVSYPTSSSIRKAVIGSSSVVSSIEKIAVDVQDVIWVDGFFSESSYPLSFLCPKDVVELKDALPNIWSQNDALQLSDDLFQAGLSHINGNLTILYCDSFEGEKQEKHPFLFSQVKTVDDLKDLPYEPLPQGKAEPCPVLPIVTIPEECPIIIDNLTIPGHESPTSLEVMFEQPLDWLLKSILGLYEENSPNDSLLKGLVAHDVIHHIYKKAINNGPEVDADFFEHIFKADFNTFFEEAVHAVGAELNLPENKLDREQFRTDLQTISIPKLIEILRYSHLTIVGSEVRSENVDISEIGYEPIRITGTIDLLLKNNMGHYVIFDFKWAGKSGRDMRLSQIKKGEDYQLALYRKMVEIGTDAIPKGTVDAQAFFMLKTGELLTVTPAFWNRKGLIPVVPPSNRPSQKSYSETLESIYDLYSAIVQSFRDGRIPTGNLKDPYLNFKVLKGKID